MDLATRGTLEQRLVELAQRGVRPDAKQLRTIAAAMADSLGFLHERRIAHRDIKPSNLLITTAGAATAAPETGPPMLLRPGERLMLGDLGLAKDLTFDSGITVGVGTAGYMAPEQSLAGAKIDTRTDIYAASALLAQIASGEPPDPLRRYSNGTIQSGRPLPPTIPAQLGRALGHGLDTDPARRPQTIEQWHAEVDQALLTLVDAEPAAQPSHPRRRLAGVAAGAIAVLGVAGVAVATLGGTAAPTTATTTTVATTTTPTTAAPTTAAPTTVAVTAATALPTAIITGPTEIPVGVQSWWSVTSSNATSGTWSLTGPVQLGDASWLPGDSFQGTWNDPGVITLTLTVFDDAGHSSQATFVFTVV
ncbi:MAG: protein kinase family protein [Acidimicrobiaceae bacterium]|nr:MAG: protein kinase family protein [Acidimicrobiaceae bacterium]